MLGLAIGYAILMWGFSRDPFALGPKLPDFLVPAALRAGNQPIVAEPAPAGDVARESGSSAVAPPGEQTDTQGDDSSSSFVDSAATKPSSEPTVSPLTNDPSPARTTSYTPNAAEPATPADDQPIDRIGESALTETTAETGPPNDRSAVDLPKAVGPRAEKRYSPQDLMAAVQSAKTTLQVAVSLPPAADQRKRNSVNRAYYKNLSKVAETLTYLDPGAGVQERETARAAAVDVFLDSVQTSAQLNEIGKLAGYWFGNPQGDGILLAGLIKDTKPSGDLVESVVQTLGKPMKGDPALITVVSQRPLAEAPGRAVLVAGTIVNHPSANLASYTGSPERVVWAAISIDPTARSSARAAERTAPSGENVNPEGDAPGRSK